MPASALLLVLFAAICHTTWNLLLKRGSRQLETQVGALAWGVVLASPVLAVYSVRDVSPTGWALIVASAVFETGYVFALTSAYAAGDLSLITRLESARCARVRNGCLPRHPMMSERIEMLPIVAASLKYAIGSASPLTASA